MSSKPNTDDVWYAKGLQFECTACGNCCTGGPGYVWASDAEIDRLAQTLKIERGQVLKQYCRKVSGRVSLKEKPRNTQGEYDCTFLQTSPADVGDGGKVAHCTRKCGVYAVRPIQCRTWPFWSGNLSSPAAWERATARCPGMNTGKCWPLSEIIRRRDAE